ncbi:NAD(P)H-hydrate dehydratase [Emticicia sp. BO119]|uniref:NAD(P)H-hydrate dehydratase n=1 Tax=Emticicia sp. BO119 TaxID=2757768 RepID=UPI0015F010BC|nr:NAD(P)H-hydrate dehydratase [Emticicia sp. BO119]MBA4849722.1 NAD(P)H-hydrate dehydratase [Emticicia sp. BO119]
MKILLTRKKTEAGNYISEIKEADEYTIAHQSIASIDLMEQASSAFVSNFIQHFPVSYKKIIILCGLGDNGGDGLAIARMLYALGYEVKVYIINYSSKQSINFQINLERLKNKIHSQWINNPCEIPDFLPDELVIDAILGVGLSRPLEGLIKSVAEKLNKTNNEIVAVDIPTGLFADSLNAENDAIIKATQTITFQLPKLAFVLPQNAELVGSWTIVNIGLNESFIEKTQSTYVYTDNETANALIKPRKKFANKGNFGHAMMMAGSYGMIGAAVLSTKACLRSGVGKITIYTPECGYEILQTAIPEAMCLCDKSSDFLERLPELDNYQAVGIGCGIGTNKTTVAMVEELLKKVKVPVVIDADALNIIAANKNFLKLIPKSAILTPHPKEFQRLIGKKWQNDYEKLEILKDFAIEHHCIVCLKGAFTSVALPDGTIHFNSTGNPGMAKGGSGDVLTGIILALLAQGYVPEEAAILGVYAHGLAGDKAAQLKGTTAMIASDIIENIKF